MKWMLYAGGVFFICVAWGIVSGWPSVFLAGGLGLLVAATFIAIGEATV